MQTYSANNLKLIQNGRQTDVALAPTASATTATIFLSLTEFSVEDSPEPIRHTDANGNRSTNTYSQVGERSFAFTASGSCDVDKLTYLLYWATGSKTVTQDGSTGAFKTDFTMLNNAVLPGFTIFYDGGAEGPKRLTGARVGEFSFSVTGDEATFTLSGMALDQDSTANVSSTIAPTVTAVTYQSSTGLTRYTFSSISLASVANGDLLVTTGLTSTNNGTFRIVTVNDTSDYVDVINPNRTSATGDQAAISVVASIQILVDAAYTDPEDGRVMLRRNSAVYEATNTAGLAAATAAGLESFEFSINNNIKEIREKTFSNKPLYITAHNIEVEASLNQILTTDNATLAESYRNDTYRNRAWRLVLEDNTVYLGTSVSYRPRVEITMPYTYAQPVRANQLSNDELRYEWALFPNKEQSITITIYSEVDITTW